MASEQASLIRAPMSSKLSQMGFMKRAAKRKAIEEAAEQPLPEVKEENAEHWTAENGEPTGCVVILEGDPEPGATLGRFSFNGANEHIEEQKIKEEQEKPHGKEKSIADEDMQEYLRPQGKRRKSSSSNPGSAGKQKSGQKSRYFQG